MNSIIQLEDSLNKLKENGVVGIKQSFEDEGVLDRDLVTMNQLCKSTGLNLSVKIGGCEAISDIYRCLDLNVNGIVAPMIESIFGLQKFTESIINILSKGIRVLKSTKSADILGLFLSTSRAQCTPIP